MSKELQILAVYQECERIVPQVNLHHAFNRFHTNTARMIIKNQLRFISLSITCSIKMKHSFLIWKNIFEYVSNQKMSSEKAHYKLIPILI